MDMKISAWAIAVVLFFMADTAAYAMDCKVDFRAKRTKTVETWYGKVDKPEYRSGITAGKGANAKACEKNAISKIERSGWKVTYRRLRRVTR